MPCQDPAGLSGWAVVDFRAGRAHWGYIGVIGVILGEFGLCWRYVGIIGVILGLYRENGKEKCKILFRV